MRRKKIRKFLRAQLFIDLTPNLLNTFDQDRWKAKFLNIKSYLSLRLDHTALRKGLEFSLVAGVVGLAGLCHAGANILFARLLSPSEFSAISTVQVFAFFIGTLAPLGKAQAVHRIISDQETMNKLPWLQVRRFIFFSSILPISFVTLVAAAVYGILFSIENPIISSFALAIFAMSVGVSNMEGAVKRFQFSPLYGQVVINLPRFCIAGVSLIILLIANDLVYISILILFVVTGLLIVFSFSGRLFFASAFFSPNDFSLKVILQRDAKLFLLTSVSLTCLTYVDRIFVTIFLSSDEFATYNAIWWVILTPFALMQTALGFVLTPQLRMAGSPEKLIHIIRLQSYFAAFLIISSFLFYYLFGEFLLEFTYSDKYSADPFVLVFLVFLGGVRVAYSIPSAIIGSIGSERDLTEMARLGWEALFLSIAFCILSVVFFGLLGVAASICVGFSFRFVKSAFLSKRILSDIHLRNAVGADDDKE